MVITRLAGGLGNQLFQYAAGRALSLRNSSTFKLDDTLLEKDPKRSFRLMFFQNPPELASAEEVERVRLAKIGSLKLSLKQTKLIDRFKPYYQRRTIKERYFHYDENFERVKSPAYLVGYWQSEKYFKHIRKVLLADIKQRREDTPRCSAFLQAIKTSKSVSMHVRRGDFISDKRVNAVHGVCSKEYYFRAMEEMEAKIKDPHFFVFSDDIPWVRANLDIGPRVTLVDQNGPERDYVDLYLMRNCAHHVIANSSFSWWGAWLSDNPGKTVIAPANWFSSTDRNTQDLIPNSWRRI